MIPARFHDLDLTDAGAVLLQILAAADETENARYVIASALQESLKVMSAAQVRQVLHSVGDALSKFEAPSGA